MLNLPGAVQAQEIDGPATHATNGAFIEQVAERHNRSESEIRKGITEHYSSFLLTSSLSASLQEFTDIHINQHAEVLQHGTDHTANVVQMEGTGNYALVIQDNTGSGSGFNPPGEGNPEPPPFQGGEDGGGNTATVTQAGADNSAVVLQGIGGEEWSDFFNPPGSANPNPPPFEGAGGGGDFTANVTQDGQNHEATIIQAGGGLEFSPPGNPNANPPPFHDTPSGNSFASITQDGENQTGTIQQFGGENTALLTQLGQDNTGLIFQAGGDNFGKIFQDGSENEALVSMTGSFNDLSIIQIGHNNYGHVEVEGDDNLFHLTQDGNNNIYEVFNNGNQPINESVIQLGDGNVSTQSGQLSGGRSANIRQEGNGMELHVRHN